MAAQLRTPGQSTRAFHFVDTSRQDLTLLHGRYLKIIWKSSSGKKNESLAWLPMPILFWIRRLLRGAITSTPFICFEAKAVPIVSKELGIISISYECITEKNCNCIHTKLSTNYTTNLQRNTFESGRVKCKRISYLILSQVSDLLLMTTPGLNLRCNLTVHTKVTEAGENLAIKLMIN